MRHGTRTIIASALAFELTTGLAGSTSTPPVPSTEVMTPDAQARYQEYFDESVAFWEKQGVPGIADTKLHFVNGDDVAYCTPFHTITAQGPSEYCAPTNTIDIAAGDVNRTGFMVEEAIVGHELGHAVQDRQTTIALVSVKAELGATCLSGSAARGTHPERLAVSGLLTVFTGMDTRVFGGDGPHGTAEQQQAAWNAGINGEGCSQYNTLFAITQPETITVAE